MASWFKDRDFQRHLVTFLCRDSNFLKSCGGMLSPKDFRPSRDDTDERYIVATIALEYYKRYSEPISGMLRPEVSDFIRKNGVDGDRKKALTKLVDKIASGEKLVAVTAMEDRVIAYLQQKKRDETIEKLILKREEDDLDQETFSEIVKEALDYTGPRKRVVSNYANKRSLENRIARRSRERKNKRPLLFIDEFDSRSKGPGRGDLGLIIALYKMGKSMLLAQLADAYAKQHLNVLYFTLEDPVEEVEDRMDAAAANLPIDRLNDLPNKLRKRFKKFSAKIQSRIRIIDATEDGISVADIDQEWERQRDQGFTADVIIIDYDDEIIPPKSHKGESSRRMEFADIYRALRKLGPKRNVIVWTAAQTKRIGEKTKIITGAQLAEDVSKIRKCALALGVGQGETHPDERYIWVAAAKRAKSKFGFAIMTSLDRGLFFDREKTARMIWSKKHGDAEAA